MWVKNSLQISSTNREVENFAEQNRNKTCLDLTRSVPTKRIEDPGQYKIELSKRWGCHSNCCQPNIKYSNPNNIVYRFRTNGYAPILWLIKVSLIYPTITFNLSSSNKYYTGYLTIKNGIISNFKDLKMM